MDQLNETALADESSYNLMDAKLSNYTKMQKPKKSASSTVSVKDKNIGKLTIIRNKIEQLRVLMRPESKLFRTLLPKTLEFGHEFTI